MTVTDIRPVTEPPQLGEIVHAEPVYLVPDNPWTTWTYRAAGIASGSWLADAATYLIHPHLLGWALATAIAATLLFAWVLGGQEAYDRNPKKFKQAL